MYERQPIGWVGRAMQLAGPLVIPVLIGALWLGLAVGALAKLDEMGRTLAQARAAKERPVPMSVPITATCQSAPAAAVKVKDRS